MIYLKIIAHRGNDGFYRENSLKGILWCLEKEYVDGVEFDVRMTKDRCFVLNHDPFYRGLFINYTLSKKLIKNGLDSLENVLNMIKTDKLLLVEVKIESSIKKTAKYLFKLLKRYNLNIYVCSFNYDFINYFSHKYSYKCGLIIGRKINKKFIKNFFDFNMISYKYKGKIPNKETFFWTVNNVNDIKNDYQNIITDKPKEIYNYLINKF